VNLLTGKLLKIAYISSTKTLEKEKIDSLEKKVLA
jgi:hypothetical protein